jgi:LemA protein
VNALMGSIKSIEEEIARQRYTCNNISQEFNTMMDTIPSSFIGHLTHLPKLEYIRFEEAIKTPPEVEF